MWTLSGIQETFIHPFIAVLVIGILWFVVFLITLAVCLFKTKDRTEKWAKPFFIGCNSRDYKYIYIVRVIFETPSLHREIIDSAISLSLLEETQSKQLLIITVDTNRLNTYDDFKETEPNKSVIRFLVYTKRSLQTMDTIVLNLMSNGSLKIFNIEIQDIDDINSDANVAQVGEQIKRMTAIQAMNAQIYPIMGRHFREIEQSVSPSRLLNPYEYLLFIWMTLNLICVFPSFLIVCNGQILFCENYDKDWLSTIYTGITSSLCSTIIFVVLISIYRYLLKYRIEISFNSMFWNTFRFIYLLLITLIGVMSAIMASFLVSNLPHKASETDICLFWISSAAIGIASFLLFWLLIVAILGNFIYFFGRRMPQTDPEKTGISDRNKEKTKKMDKKEESDKTMEEESDDYFKSLVKAGHKVKSISQYKGVVAKKSPQKEIQKEDQSIGDTYFKELMKTQGKVSSVSQYEDKNKNTN